MKKRQIRSTTGDKGFTLTELLLVILAVLFLVCVLTPPLLQYANQVKVSSDAQTAENIRLAVMAALMDPEVEQDQESQEYLEEIRRRNNTPEKALAIHALPDNLFVNAVAEALGVSRVKLLCQDELLRSKAAEEKGNKLSMEIRLWISDRSQVGILIYGSDSGARDDLGRAIPITVTGDR